MVTITKVRTRQEWEAFDLRPDGYRVGVVEDSIGAEMARDAACTVCGSVGLQQHQYTKTLGLGILPAYRALWECRACGHCEEV